MNLPYSRIEISELSKEFKLINDFFETFLWSINTGISLSLQRNVKKENHLHFKVLAQSAVQRWESKDFQVLHHKHLPHHNVVADVSDVFSEELDVVNVLRWLQILVAKDLQHSSKEVLLQEQGLVEINWELHWLYEPILNDYRRSWLHWSKKEKKKRKNGSFTYRPFWFQGYLYLISRGRLFLQTSTFRRDRQSTNRQRLLGHSMQVWTYQQSSISFVQRNRISACHRCLWRFDTHFKSQLGSYKKVITLSQHQVTYTSLNWSSIVYMNNFFVWSSSLRLLFFLITKSFTSSTLSTNW